MKALTLWQPWASLVALGHKKVETRCWSTKYRGLIAIHSAKNLPPNWLGKSVRTVDFQFELREALGCDRLRDDHLEFVKQLPRGSMLCIVSLMDIRETDRIQDDISQRERIFGNYEEGRYAWFLEMVERFETPIPAKGNRMLWNWSAR